MTKASEEKGLPKELYESGEFKQIWLNNQSRIKEIDSIFIERGFATVEACIQRDTQLCGKDSYALFVDQQAHPERIDEWRDVSQALLQEIYDASDNGKAAPSHYIHVIMSHPTLSCLSKKELMGRFFPEQHLELWGAYLPLFREARLKERQQLCTLWGGQPPVRLYGKESVPLRKEVMNSVALDAFGALGFTKRNMSSGIIRLHKPITDRYAIIVAPDTLIINTQAIHSRDHGVEYEDWYGSSSLDWSTYIGASKKADSTKWYYFTPPFFSYALSQFNKFRSTHEMEVSIRAQALRYELLIKPYESVISQYGGV